MSGGGCNKGSRPVKIVIINTQYVETDANSFKSVVQKLTGKEYSATQEEEATKLVIKETEKKLISNQNRFEGKSILLRDDEPFKDLDWFLSQIPPVINDDIICFVP